MKNKLFLLITILFLLNNAYGVAYFDGFPSETILLKFPENETHWREVYRRIDAEKLQVDFISCDQPISNTADVISIQYFNLPVVNENSILTIENYLYILQEGTRIRYPKNEVVIKIIEKNKTDFICERVIPKNQEEPLQHVIARCFLAQNRIHCVEFIHKNSKIEAKEREKWIKLLKESTSLVNLKDAVNVTNGISLADPHNDLFDLGPAFDNWKIATTYAFSNGHRLVDRIPSSLTVRAYIDEVLETVTHSPHLNLVDVDISELFETEKELVQKKTFSKVQFRILQESPNEIIYFYSYPHDHLKLNAVVRTLLSNQGYYTISYKHGLTELMQEEEILHWKDQLAKISFHQAKPCHL